jgi:hypothetical protein
MMAQLVPTLGDYYKEPKGEIGSLKRAEEFTKTK